MSEDRLDAFLKALETDEGLQQKMLAAEDLEAAVAVANEAGYEITIPDWLRRQAQETLKLNDDEVLEVAGGRLIADKANRQVVASLNASVGAAF